jgi:hypothetical protein
MESQSLPDAYYTWQSLGTLAIAAGAVIVASNTIRTLLKLDSPWVPFLVALGLTMFGAFSSHQLNAVSDWVLAALNSCLLFCTATGANHGLVAAKPRLEGEVRPYGRRKVTWLSPWFK